MATQKIDIMDVRQLIQLKAGAKAPVIALLLLLFTGS
jgi:hypothetical protein